MRRRVLPVVAGLIFVALWACGKDDTPTEPIISLDRDSLGFGQEFGSGVFVGTSKQESLLIRNMGGANLVISTVDFTGPSVFGMELPPQEELTVAPGDHTFIRFTFTPEEPQSYTAAATIRSNADNEPEKLVEISGRGVAPPTDGGM